MRSLQRVAQRYKSALVGYAVAVVLLLVVSAIKPEFGSVGHLRVIAIEASIMGLFALGQTLVVLTGGIDLSIPWTMNCAAILLTYFTHGQDQMLPIVMPLVLLGSFATGLLNGLGVAYLEINPMIMTFGMNSILAGGLLAFTGGRPGGYSPPIVAHVSTDALGGIPILAILWLVIIVIVTIVLSMTPYGRRLYAVGNSEQVSFFSGVNVRITKALAYGVSGLSAGMGGIALCGRIGQSYLGMGDYVVFQTLAIVAVGGTSLSGGSGTYVGTVGGALVVTILIGVLSVFKMSTGVQQILYGVVLLIAVVAARDRRGDTL